MATIVVAPLGETGHLNATFGLARTLAAAGHRVAYLLRADLLARARAQGFAAYELGAAAPPDDAASYFAAGRLGRALGHRRAAFAFFRAVAAAPLDETLRGLGADLVLADQAFPAAALAAHRARVRCCIVNTTLPVRRARGYPPLTSGLIPRGGWWSQLAVAAAWQRVLVARAVGRRLARFTGTGTWRRAYAELARGCGYDGPIDHATCFGPELALPQLVLCPRAFDFPDAPRFAGLHYAAPFVDTRRDDGAAELPGGDGPLVYCSLGSQGQRLRACAPLFRRVIAALAARPGLRGLIAVGRHLDPAQLGPVPPNVRVVASAPQLAVLARAALMITHAGLNSIKESIWFGVPMIACPLGWDQPGNAARIERHGLGERAAVGESAAALGRRIDRVLAGRGFRERTRAMAARFADAEHRRDGLAIIEGLL